MYGSVSITFHFDVIHAAKKIQELLDKIVKDRILNIPLYRTCDNQMPQVDTKPFAFLLLKQ